MVDRPERLVHGWGEAERPARLSRASVFPTRPPSLCAGGHPPHPNSGSPEFGTLSWPKSDISDLGWGGIPLPRQHRHDLAHVPDALRAHLIDGLRNRRLHLRLGHLLRKIGADHVNLGSLAIGELLAAGRIVEGDRFLALLDHLLQDAQQIAVGKLRPARELILNIGVLDGSADKAQRRYPALIPRLHGALERGVDLLAQHGYGPFLSALPSRADSQPTREPARARTNTYVFNARDTTHASGGAPGLWPGLAGAQGHC